MKPSASSSPSRRPPDQGVRRARGHKEMDGAGDEFHRLALNLLENALSHTDPGTRR